jgi:S-adenosylmethionine synthetase
MLHVILKNLVAAGVADEILVQVSYAIGLAKPMGIFIDTYGTSKLNLTNGEIAKKVEAIFDMRPYFIEQRLKLRNPIYSETAAYGHMGRTPETVTKHFLLQVGIRKRLRLNYFGKTRFCRPSESCFWIVVRFITKENQLN